MTQKMTITLEEALIKSVTQRAKLSGKKKTQIIREALQAYLYKENDDAQKWKEANAVSIQSYNACIEQEGTFSTDLRSF